MKPLPRVAPLLPRPQRLLGSSIHTCLADVLSTQDDRHHICLRGFGGFFFRGCFCRLGQRLPSELFSSYFHQGGWLATMDAWVL